ncbi:hypothetical protein DFS33DRAFT_1319008 [Desarmillaria ectypa]|nr:hypothetical protein DFS33DRAFT_1319008 [Desarmillaria ectypa]
MSISSVGKLLLAKYTPPAATILILWDHCLTLDEEVATMWRVLNGQILTKLIYIMNRYFMEAVMLYTTYVFTGLRGTTANMDCAKMFWLFTMSAIVLASISQFFIMMRAYRLWNHRPIIRRVLPIVFVACITGALVFSVMTVPILLRTRIELVPPKVMVCAVVRVPKTIASALGILILFNLLVIFVSIYNALENPRRCESEVLDSLRRDGARVYLVSPLPFPSDVFLWVLLLITSLVTDVVRRRLFSRSLSLVCSLKANLTSRMHLRIEGLSNTTRPGMIYIGQED